MGDVPATELLRPARADHRETHVVRLTVVAGPDAGAVAVSTGERVVIGTADGVDLRVSDATVSRFHCELESTARGVVLRDLGSTNGTRLGRVVALAAIVGDGDELTLGRTTVRIAIGESPGRVALASADRFGYLVGRSVAMRQAFAALEAVAGTSTTVLLLGETGTGKEAAAESLHAASPRAGGPFVVIDCGALPATLLESELFGHERGAFTGAHAARPGAFESAAGGTVFLDEIGELSPELQPKLLRVLERREVKRLGAERPVAIDFRVVAATHRDLRAQVNDKRFRPDLYFRLAVVPITLPALRERPDDLPLLVESILGALGHLEHPGAELLRSPDFLAELAGHGWPGNVRELRNYVERCLVLREPPTLERPAREGGAVAAPVADGVVDASEPFGATRDAWLARFERDYLLDLLRRHDDNVSAAGRAGGIDRAYLYRLLRRHGLR